MATSRQPTRPVDQSAQNAAEQTSGKLDAATAVVLMMRQLGVVGLPRNYELFYEAITVGSRELTEAITALGNRPTQKQLDAVARRHLGRSDDWAVDDAHDKITTRLDEIITLLRKERISMETYGKILGETSHGLSGRQAISREFLDKIVSVTASATRKSIENRSQIVSSIVDKSGELQEVKSKLEEYKRLAETDALSQLHNRRAFDRTMSAIYDVNRGVPFGALILADIDHFKSVNDRFGHPVGDRIIQIVSSIIRAAVKEAAFVARTGGEEFAIVVRNNTEDTVCQVAEDIRHAVMEAPFVNLASGTNYGPITVSLGFCMVTQAQSPDELYVKADRALYASKSAGRNRVTRFSALTEGSFVKNWLLYRKS